jgi:tripartite-type tricarboxylate transporter receptor subunit TctC
MLMTTTPITRRQVIAASAAVTLAAPSFAQAWPAKPIKLVVPFSAGGSLDNTARLVAEQLGQRLGQAVAVENVTGGGGSVGITRVIGAPADGHTILIAGDAPMNPEFAKGGNLYRHDMLRELTPIGLVNTAPMLIVAHPSVPANNLDELVALAKSKPGALNYATSGVGTVLHLCMEMIKQAKGIFVVHIPYRGGTQIVADVAGKQVELAMLITASAQAAIRAGQVKPLAITSAKRLPSLPNVAAVAESAGMAGFDVASWSGLYAPANTPAAVVDRVNRELSAVLTSEAVAKRLGDSGAVPGGGTREAFVKFITDDRARYAAITKTVSIAA